MHMAFLVSRVVQCSLAPCVNLIMGLLMCLQMSFLLSRIDFVVVVAFDSHCNGCTQRESN